MHPTNLNQAIKPVKSIFLDIVGYSERNVELQKFVVSERDKIILATLDAMEVRDGERVLNPIGDGLYIALLASPEQYDLHLLETKY